MQKITRYLRNLSSTQRVLLVGWLILMTLLPFHAFISTWGGTAIGPYSLWKVWKEVVLALLCIPVGVLLFTDDAIWKKVKASWALRVAGLYVLIHIAVAAILGRDPDAVLYGLAINLRIVVFFFTSFVLFSSLRLSKKSLIKVVLLPCAVVVAFGLMQLFVLPNNFLSHFGYEKGVTIAPTNTIDEQPDEIRIMSTLRGPNPLGAYLILPGALLVSSAFVYLRRARRQGLDTKTAKVLCFVSLALLLILVALYGTHGRAAWIGFAASIGLVVFLSLSKKLRLWAIIAGLILICVGSVGIYQLRDTGFVQTVILHDNPETGAEITSNDAHITAAKDGLDDIAKKPLTGCGPGCAGPASFYYNKGTNLAENYYIQVAQEVGVVGLALFLAFVALVGRSLFIKRADPIALALFASLVGISLANFLLHVWADDTLAYVWWGLAGAVLASDSLRGSSTATAKRLRTSD